MSTRTQLRNRLLSIIKPVTVALVVLSSLVIVGFGQSRQLQVLSIQSSSMAPVLQKGDAVVVYQADPSLIQIGDLVSLPHPDESGVSITHRVVQFDIDTGQLITKGDANRLADPPTHVGAVTGEVRQRLGHAGYVIDGLRSWPGIIGAVYVPMALVLGGELVRIGRYYGRPTYSVQGYDV